MGRHYNSVAVLGLCSMVLTIIDSTLACPSVCVCKEDESTKLATVECKGQAITSFPTNIPNDTEFLKIILTNITEVPENALKNFTHLEKVQFAGNAKLKKIPDGVFDNLNQLLLVIIYSNKNLTVLPPGLFRNLPKLKKVYLRGNALTALPENTFRNLTDLDFVDASYNKITSLSENLFDDTVPKLRKLYLNSNRLTTLPNNFFSSISGSLKLLLLDYNKFNKMPMKALRSIQNLTEIVVAGNPLYCNCSLKSFVDWARSIIHRDIYCSDGAGRPLSEFNLSHCATEKETTTPKPTTIPTQQPTNASPVTQTSTQTLQSLLNLTTTLVPTFETSPPETGEPGSETQDSSGQNKKRKVVILAISVSAVVAVILVAIVVYLFHTGILSTRCGMKFKKNKMIVYDADGNILVKDGKIVP